MVARIYKPAKTAMQSGLARTKEWVLEQEPGAARAIDPLMGWTSSTDTAGQVHLEFDTRDEAIAYAERNGIAYSVTEPEIRKPVRKSYADNFKFGPNRFMDPLTNVDRSGAPIRAYLALKAIFALAAGLIAGFGSGDTGARAAGNPCREVTHEQGDYVVCELDTRRHVFALNWKGADGQALGYLSRLPEAGPIRGQRLVVATNAGMYHPDLAPVGLYVERGRELKKIVTKGGGGNFFLRPNGVFFVGPQGAGVLTTEAYVKQKPAADIATQSGPMLVIDGKLHPRFTKEGVSQKVRSGVGVRDSTTVMLAISRGPVSFGAFARLFRDKLACPNALFLDGSISALKGPGFDVGQGLLPFGPMLGVYEIQR